jgi:hypothetical protein
VVISKNLIIYSLGEVTSSVIQKSMLSDKIRSLLQETMAAGGPWSKVVASFLMRLVVDSQNLRIGQCAAWMSLTEVEVEDRIMTSVASLPSSVVHRPEANCTEMEVNTFDLTFHSSQTS